MKMRMYPLTVEARGDEVVLIQEQAGSQPMTITLSVDQVDSLRDVLFKAREYIWEQREAALRKVEESQDATSFKNREVETIEKE